MIDVLLVDDHELVRSGIRRLLNDAKGIRVVGEAASGEEAISLAASLRPHVVLMDVRMPGIGGLEATRKLLRVSPETRVVVVTALQDEPFPTRLLQAGALGYVTKGSGVEEMVRAIRTVNAGQRYISPQVAQQIALRHIVGEEPGPFDGLSEREMQVLLMITAGRKVQDISDKLCLSPKTVNSYRYRLFEKLGVQNDVELTRLALRHGLIETEDPK